MDKQIQKLKKLVERYLHTPKEEILKTWGKPLKHSDNEIWFYNRYKWKIFKDEVTFLFQFGENCVTDIMITRYIVWKKHESIFYYEEEDEYRVMKFNKHRNRENNKKPMDPMKNPITDVLLENNIL